MEEINKKEREKLWEQSHVRPALENLVPRSVVKKIQSEEEADIKVIDPERQLKGIEHKLEQEKVRSGEKWNVDKLFPLTKPKNISSPVRTSKLKSRSRRTRRRSRKPKK